MQVQCSGEKMCDLDIHKCAQARTLTSFRSSLSFTLSRKMLLLSGTLNGLSWVPLFLLIPAHIGKETKTAQVTSFFLLSKSVTLPTVPVFCGLAALTISETTRLPEEISVLSDGNILVIVVHQSSGTDSSHSVMNEARCDKRSLRGCGDDIPEILVTSGAELS